MWLVRERPNTYLPHVVHTFTSLTPVDFHFAPSPSGGLSNLHLIFELQPRSSGGWNNGILLATLERKKQTMQQKHLASVRVLLPVASSNLRYLYFRLRHLVLIIKFLRAFAWSAVPHLCMLPVYPGDACPYPVEYAQIISTSEKMYISTAMYR